MSELRFMMILWPQHKAHYEAAEKLQQTYSEEVLEEMLTEVRKQLDDIDRRLKQLRKNDWRNRRLLKQQREPLWHKALQLSTALFNNGVINDPTALASDISRIRQASS